MSPDAAPEGSTIKAYPRAYAEHVTRVTAMSLVLHTAGLARVVKRFNALSKGSEAGNEQ